MRIRFDQINQLSQLSKDKFGIDLTIEVNEFMQVYTIEKYSLSSTIDMFKTHYEIQKNVTKSNAVDGYEELLLALNNVISEKDCDVFQINIVTENSGYILFTDLQITELFGVLKMNRQRIDRKLELNESD
jgi:hypothetical protein